MTHPGLSFMRYAPDRRTGALRGPVLSTCPTNADHVAMTLCVHTPDVLFALAAAYRRCRAEAITAHVMLVGSPPPEYADTYALFLNALDVPVVHLFPQAPRALRNAIVVTPVAYCGVSADPENPIPGLRAPVAASESDLFSPLSNPTLFADSSRPDWHKRLTQPGNERVTLLPLYGLQGVAFADLPAWIDYVVLPCPPAVPEMTSRWRFMDKGDLGDRGWRFLAQIHGPR